MYSVYKRGGYPRPPVLPVGNKCCPPIPGIVSTATGYVDLGNTYKSLSESGRIQEQQCTTMYISNAPVSVQIGSSNNIPYVNVIPASASGTTQSLQNAVLFAANNPYNPATRFSQYRFSNTILPPPPPCPVSVPNPGYVGVCVPPSIFRGSVPP